MSMKDKNQGDLKNDTCNTSMIQMIPIQWSRASSGAHIRAICIVDVLVVVMMTLVTYIGRKKMMMMMLRMRIIAMIESCKWRTPLRHLYCPWGGRHRKAFEERFGLGFSTACQTIIRMAGMCKTFEKLTSTLTLMMARSDHLGRAGGKATSLKPGSYH